MAIPAKARTGRAIKADAAPASGASRARNVGRRGQVGKIAFFARVALEQNEGVDKLSLGRHGGPKRPGGNTKAVAKGRAGVNDGKLQILGEARILQAVVHDQDIGAVMDRLFGRGKAVGKDVAGRDARQQQRLVSDLFGAVRVDIDPERDGLRPAAIAARKKRHAPARLQKLFRDRQRRRRLAGAAGDKIADANHRHVDLRRGRRPCAAAPARHKSRPSGASERANSVGGRTLQNRGALMRGGACSQG